MPKGRGLWPAIWMLPTDLKYGGWPHSGEIDIFEAFGPGDDSIDAFDPLNTLHGTLHYGFSWPWNQNSGAPYVPEANIWDEFHTYSIEWEEGEIRWFVDDHHFATQKANGWFSYYWGGQEIGYQIAGGAQPFDEAFHMLLNVAVGSPWLGYPNENNTFPQTMEVDFVRVYECSADPETGLGCSTGNPDVAPLAGHTPPADVRDEVSLYNEGPQTLTFDVDGNEVNNTLVPGFWELNGGTVISNPAFDAGEDGIVWDIDFNGVGNAFLSTADMTGVEGVKSGFDFGDNLNSRVKNLGDFKFNLKVLDIDATTKLRIKLDSGWPNLSFHEIDIPDVGEWTEVSVRLYSLQPNDAEAWRPAVDYTKITNPFVIEPVGGTAHIQLSDIRIVCLQDAGGGCNIQPVPADVALTETFDIYVDGEVGSYWDFGLGKWDGDSGHVTVSEVEDAERGEVVNVTFSESGNNGLAFIQATAPRDVSAFEETGYLEFDIKVVSYGDNTGGIVVKAESGPSTGTGDYIINPAEGVWETVQITIADMLAHPGTNPAFNLAALNTPFVSLPTWGDQSGVHIQVDNIRWVMP